MNSLESADFGVKLSTLYPKLVSFCREYRIGIEMKDLTKICAQFRQPEASQNVFYAGFSNGRTIYIHNDKAIDLESKTWEVLHLTGHIFQWHMKANAAKRLTLEFYGSRARNYASKDLVSAPMHELNDFLRYELETNRIAVAIAMKISPQSRKAYLGKYLTQYCAKDMNFILKYYGRTSPTCGDRFVVPSVTELKRGISPIGLPTPEEMQLRELPLLSVPILLTK
jgi:hypothetical protein